MLERININQGPMVRAGHGAGLILVCTELMDVGETLWDDVAQMNLGAHHGVIVFGLLHILKTLPDIFEGLEYLGWTGSPD